MNKRTLVGVAVGALTVATLAVGVPALANAVGPEPTIHSSIQIVKTTDANGFLTVVVPDDFDEVYVTAESPQGGPGTIVSVTGQRIGTRKARFRVFVAGPGGTVRPAVNEEVILATLYVSHP